MIFPITGIPGKNGIEEQIQQSTLDGIYPAVIPDIIKIVDVPQSENIVVVVRVNESVHAPHAIQNSKEVYIRTGSITTPYDLVDMDRIQYMFKRREDAQGMTRQILNRIEERTVLINCGQGVPSITVIAKPIFPYRPVISISEIDTSTSYIRRVPGGVCSFPYYDDVEVKQYKEFNEYGIAYLKSELPYTNNKEIDCADFRDRIAELIQHAATLYKECGYLGTIEVSAEVKEIFDTRLMRGNLFLGPHSKCIDSEVFAAEQCTPSDLDDTKKCEKLCEYLICQLFLAYGVSTDIPFIREKVEFFCYRMFDN